jgi:hypothetical protein
MEKRNRAFTALNKAGFEVSSFRKIERGLFPPMYKIRASYSGTGPEEKEFEYETPEQQETENQKRNLGEISDICRMLSASDWRHAFNLVQEAICAGMTFNSGDFINVSFDVPAALIKGVKFDARHIEGKVIVIVSKDDRVLFNFDEIIFRSPINEKDRNEGGFHASALAEYLNTVFLDAFGVRKVLQTCNGTWEEGKEHKISLPTAFEIFGDEEYWEPTSDFFDTPEQLEHYKYIKNRIKVFENDTCSFWTSSKWASSAAAFCYCSYGGYSGSGSGSGVSAVGGVAPGFCVAPATPL